MTRKDLNKSRKSKVEEIARRYFAEKGNIELPIVTGKNRKIFNGNIVLRVQTAYDSLDTLDQEFINNEFFGERYRYWWVNKYPPTTYYRYLNAAVWRFLLAYVKTC